MNSYDYFTETAKSSLRASMKSDILIETDQSDKRHITILSLREDIAFLHEIKDRCTELTTKLGVRNLTLFRNKNLKDKASIQPDNMKITSSKNYYFEYEFCNILEENIDFARKTCSRSIDLAVNSHNLSTDYETRIVSIGNDLENLISIEELTDSLIEIKEGLYFVLEKELELEREENEAMINAEIEASIYSKKSKAMLLKAEKLKSKIPSHQQSKRNSIEAKNSKFVDYDSSKSIITTAPLAVPESDNEEYLNTEKKILSCSELIERDASTTENNPKGLKRNPTESMYNIGSADKLSKSANSDGDLND